MISGNNDTVIDTIFYDNIPTDIALNPERNLIYITYPSLNLIAVVDGMTNKVIENITDIKKPLYVTVSPVYNEIYITNQSRNVFIIDGYTNRHIFTLPLGVIPYDIEIDENLNKMFVTYSSENPDDIQYILSIDREGVRYTMNSITLGRSPDNVPIFASNPNTGVVYAVYEILMVILLWP